LALTSFSPNPTRRTACWQHFYQIRRVGRRVEAFGDKSDASDGISTENPSYKQNLNIKKNEDYRYFIQLHAQ
jgi:hypothetical protein